MSKWMYCGVLLSRGGKTAAAGLLSGSYSSNQAVYHLSTVGLSWSSSPSQSCTANQWKWQSTDFPGCGLLSEADDQKGLREGEQWRRRLKLIDKPCTVCVCVLYVKQGIQGFVFLKKSSSFFIHTCGICSFWRTCEAEGDQQIKSDKQRSVPFNEDTFVILGYTVVGSFAFFNRCIDSICCLCPNISVKSLPHFKIYYILLKIQLERSQIFLDHFFFCQKGQ